MPQPSHIYASTLSRRRRRWGRRRGAWLPWIAALGALLVLAGALLLS
jgi:hypothetical protein